MTKLKLGTIGTSWITDSFIEGALATSFYDLNTIYSRNKEKGEEFASKYDKVLVETDFNKFLTNKELDVIYVASPNSLHYEQSLLALQAKKHVIVEKPATLNVKQWDHLLEEADKNKVFILEAARHMHLPNLEIIQKEVEELGEIRGGIFPYVRYSSRYDNVLAGEEPNVFSLNFAGGALMDLGIYPIYTAVALFGKPKENYYFAQKIATGVDGIGTVILRYEKFDLTILVGKNASSAAEVEIYGADKTLIIDHVSHLAKARLLDIRTFAEQDVELEAVRKNDMYYEALTLAEMILQPNSTKTKERYQHYSNLARIVTELLDELREQAGIVFKE